MIARILFGALNWLSSMAIGMTFGLSFGALMHTILQFYPLRIGKNYTLNSMKGALAGVPMGVCANCAVPMACGITRGNGRVEVALGYLFSSPNFNPVVIAITFTILPWYFGAVKYLVLLFVILFLVPRLIRFLEGRGALTPFRVNPVGASCSLELPDQTCAKPFLNSVRQVFFIYAKHVWMLFKPTISLMLIASILASALLVLVPWNSLLGTMSAWRMLAASALGVFMPVPIALDVLFAGELHRNGISAGYTIMFLMTLGTYSVIPAIYLWRDVSRSLAVSLFSFFVAAGASLGFLFAVFS
ncbi:MAG: permease [Acidobacteriota bacterium]|nr:permease [Acidobacteriota bacterium]